MDCTKIIVDGKFIGFADEINQVFDKDIPITEFYITLKPAQTNAQQLQTVKTLKPSDIKETFMADYHYGRNYGDWDDEKCYQYWLTNRTIKQ